MRRIELVVVFVVVDFEVEAVVRMLVEQVVDVKQKHHTLASIQTTYTLQDIQTLEGLQTAFLYNSCNEQHDVFLVPL
jgi:hypothetical protein